ncbi:MAG: HypC/HybG/HupF family hydrogenase formation chaperone [Bacteroidetes bacterium]|nr:HypC/HybG/HupF family hydrogenase formation chaperone [Bacteroidota bacterium]
MCLAIPAKVIRVNGSNALVLIEDTEYNASLLLLEDVKEGDYVMLHAGFAIQKVDEEEAKETMRLLNEVASYNPESGNEVH